MPIYKQIATVAAAGLGAAALFAAAPAHASINDQYQCARNDGAPMIVEIQFTRPGFAMLYYEPADGSEATVIELTGVYDEDGFRFANGGTVFEGSGFDATLDYQRASFECTMPIPNELYEAAMEPRILLDGHGLTVLRPDRGISLRLPFGSSVVQVDAALEGLMGQPTVSTALDECPAGPLEFRDFGALSLHFQESALVGWSMNEGAFLPARITLPNGAHIDLSGEYLPEWMGDFPDSTLGIERYGDGVHAMLSEDDGTITTMWGGAACVFR